MELMKILDQNKPPRFEEEIKNDQIMSRQSLVSYP